MTFDVPSLPTGNGGEVLQNNPTLNNPIINGQINFGNFPSSFIPGIQSGISVDPWMGLALERRPGQFKLQNIWPSSNTEGFFGISEFANRANDPAGAVAHQGPRWAMYIDMVTSDTILDGVALGITNLGTAANAHIIGTNYVVGNNNAAVTAALVTGIEIDVQGSGPATFKQGMEVQAFDTVTVDVAFRTTRNGTGSFVNGIDLSGGSFTNAAMKIGNNQFVKFSDNPLTTPAFMGLDTSNTFQLNNPTTGGFQLSTNGAFNILVFSNDVYINRPTGNVFRIRENNGADQFTVQAGGVTKYGAASFTANASTAVSLTNIAPAGAHATVQEWFTVQNSAGTVRYIPAF